LLGAGQSQTAFRVLPVARVGGDETGRSVLREMTETGIDTRYITTSSGRPTLFSVCFQYPDGSGGNITSSNSAAADLDTYDLRAIEPELKQAAPQTIALAAPEVSLEVRRAFLNMATHEKAFRVASFVSAEVAACTQTGIFNALDLVSLNEEEARLLTDITFDCHQIASFVERMMAWLSDNHPALRMVVSTGSHGAFAFHQGRWNYCPAIEVEAMSTAGAGDALLSGILAGLAAGLPLLRSDENISDRPVSGLQTALELGVLLASFKVQSQHTIHPEACLDTILEFGEHRGIRLHPTVKDLIRPPGSL